MVNYRPTYLFLGIVLLLMTGFLIFVAVMAGDELLPQTYILIALTIMTFCLAYLQPQFKKEDERFKFIRQKAMFITYIAVMGYYIVFMTLLQFDFVTLTALEVVNILAALTIVTVFLSMVVLSKVY